MTAPQPSLRRILTFWPLLFYGLGVIVGAGIYVAIGTVIARAGDTAPRRLPARGDHGCDDRAVLC